MKHKLWKILPLTMIILLAGFGALFGVNAQPWNGGTASAFASGSGTQNDPYVIENADQLSYLAKSVNGSKTYYGVYFALANDIVLNDESFAFDSDTGLVKVSDGTNTAYLGTGIKGDGSKSNAVFDTVASEAGAWYKSDTSKTKGAYAGTINTWTPIGNSKVRFEGNFDGKDHTVSGIYINNTLDYGGLFGYTSADLENIKVTSSYIHAGEFTGAIAGSNLYSTKGCAVNAIVCSDQNNVGGVIGKGGTVTESLSACVVRGAQSVGGIAGNARVEKCCNNGNVYGDVSVGGIVGSGRGADNLNTANVFGTESVGGVCGSVSIQLSTSYNIGTVYGEKYVGAVLGRLVEGSVTNCYYLSGCAADVSEKIQNGFGTEKTGSSRTDDTGMTCALDETQIGLEASFSGFDFENIWIMSDGAPMLIVLKDETHTHVYDNACDGACNLCGDTREVSHSYKTEWSKDQASHWRECSVCFDKKDTAAHKAGAAVTETTPQVCEVCAYVITPALGHTHKYSNAWSYDSANHWYACSCGEKQGASTHRYDNSCDTACNDCGYVRTITHSYKTEWSKDQSSHWRECSVCFDKKDTAAHKAGTAATETTPQLCEVCAYVITPALGHTHKYSNAWSYDSANHWYACSCGEKQGASTHRYDNSCDTACNDCGYVRAITHSYKTEWSTDQSSHWRECSVCFDKKDTAAHKAGAAATETTPQVCEVCAYVITPAIGHTHKYSNAWSYDSANHWYACSCGEKQGASTHRYDNSCDTACNDCGYVRAITHSYKTEWSTDQTSHWHECSVCFDKKDTAAHKAGTAATETTPQLCEVCAYVITPALGHTHKYSNAWSYDSANHWYACSCGEKQGASTHRYDNSCDTACNDCGYVRAITHSYKTEWSKDQSSHWRECSVCFDKKDTAAHKAGAAATETTPQVCEVCAYVITPALGHTHSYSGAWSSDNTNHWHECTCGDKRDIEKHKYDNNCDEICNECGYKRAAEHTYGEIKKYDDKSHWLECSVCMNKKQTEIHVFDNMCDTNCNGCGYTRKITHVYSGDWSSDADGHWHECVLCKARGEASQHSWNSGAVTKEPTKDEEGIRTYKCSDCSYTKTEPIAKLPTVNTGASTTASAPVTTAPITTSDTTGAITTDVTGSVTTTKAPETSPNTEQNVNVNTNQSGGDDASDNSNGYFILAVVLGVISIILLIAFLIMLLYVWKKKK